MQRSDLITLIPKERKKEYKKDSLRINNLEGTKFTVQTNVRSFLKNSKFLNQSKENLNILNNLKNSYEKLFNNEEFVDKDFVLSGHELLEYQQIDDSHKLRYLLYRYKYNSYPKQFITREYPPCVQIEPTSICNYRCVMCYQKDTSFSKKSNGFMGHMDINLFKKIIDELEGKIEAVTLASRGEPTLHQKLPEMLKYLNGKFLGLKLNTNASLLNEKLSHEILSSDIQTLVFSIDAADKENYEKIRVNGSYEKLTKNLETFDRVKREHYSKSKIITRVSGVAINKTISSDDMQKVWGKFVETVALVNFAPLDDTYNNPINSLKGPCSELWRRMFIWWDGKANPCDVDYKSTLSKSNVEKEMIKDIWNSEWYDLIRSKHLEKKRAELNPCRRCINT
jgi:organic radical activating enzyme